MRQQTTDCAGLQNELMALVVQDRDDGTITLGDLKLYQNANQARQN